MGMGMGLSRSPFNSFAYIAHGLHIVGTDVIHTLFKAVINDFNISAQVKSDRLKTAIEPEEHTKYDARE